MNIKKGLLLLYVFLLPVDAFGAFRFSLVGPIYASIVDFLIVIMLYLSLLEIMVKRQSFTRYDLKVLIVLSSASVLSFVSFAYIEGYNIAFDLRISLSMLEFSAMIFVFLQTIRDEKFLRTVLKTLCLSVFLICVITILKSLGLEIPGHVRTTTLTFGPFAMGVLGGIEGVMHFAVLLLGTLPFLFNNWLIKSSSARTVLVATFLFTAILSLSRSLWIAASVQMLIYIWLFSIYSDKLGKRIIFSLLLMLSLGFLMVYLKDIIDAIVALRPVTFEKRIVFQRESYEVFSRQPLSILFGIGKGVFYERYDQAIVHNFLLDLLLSKGIFVVGLLTYLLLDVLFNLLRVIRAGRTDGNGQLDKYAAGFFLVIVGVIVEGQSAPITNLIIFWTFLGITCSYLSIIQREQTALAPLGQGAEGRRVPAVRPAAAP